MKIIVNLFLFATLISMAQSAYFLNFKHKIGGVIHCLEWTKDGKVTMNKCDPGSEGQRWMAGQVNRGKLELEHCIRTSDDMATAQCLFFSEADKKIELKKCSESGNKNWDLSPAWYVDEDQAFLIRTATKTLYMLTDHSKTAFLSEQYNFWRIDRVKV